MLPLTILFLKKKKWRLWHLVVVGQTGFAADSLHMRGSDKTKNLAVTTTAWASNTEQYDLNHSGDKV